MASYPGLDRVALSIAREYQPNGLDLAFGLRYYSLTEPGERAVGNL
jgi:hypothetical protein